MYRIRLNVLVQWILRTSILRVIHKTDASVLDKVCVPIETAHSDGWELHGGLVGEVWVDDDGIALVVLDEGDYVDGRDHSQHDGDGKPGIEGKKYGNKK